MSIQLTLNGHTSVCAGTKLIKVGNQTCAYRHSRTTVLNPLQANTTKDPDMKTNTSGRFIMYQLLKQQETLQTRRPARFWSEVQPYIGFPSSAAGCFLFILLNSLHILVSRGLLCETKLVPESGECLETVAKNARDVASNATKAHPNVRNA